MRDAIWLNGKEYRIARTGLSDTGARRWAVTQRPSQRGDPSRDEEAIWNISGPNLFSFEVVPEGENTGYLGVEYSTGVDTRFTDTAILSAATTSVDCSTGDSLATSTTNGIVLTGALNATYKYIYVIRGREPKKVRLTNWTAYDSGINLAEAATDIEYTKTSAGTEEISIGMLATAYHVVSAVGTDAAADTASANNETTINRIIGLTMPTITSAGESRAIGMSGQVIRGNVLSGSVTMDASAWGAIETLAGYNVLPTGFSTDGNQWVLGYDIGPIMYDDTTDAFFPLFPESPRSSSNCMNMTTWGPMGAIIPMARGLRNLSGGRSESIGPERFLMNTSPVSGRCTAAAGTDHWLYAIFYDEPNDDSYLCAGHPRQPGEPHTNPMSWFVLKQWTDTKVHALANIFNGDEALTSPTFVGGLGTNIFYMTQGRYAPYEPADTLYRFQTSGILYFTELRRQPGVIKDLVSVELTSAACGASDTLTLGFSVDGGSYNDLSGTTDYASGATLNGVVNTNGFQRVLFVDNSAVPLSWSSGRRVKPRITFAASANTASPKIEGALRIQYKARPIMASVFEFDLRLDESQVWGTVEEQGERLFTELGAGPVLMTEDVDGDSYYIRIESVVVKEEQERGGGATRDTGAIRVATVRGTKHPSVAGD